MTESQSPQDGSFAAPRTGVPAGTEPYSGSYLDSPVDTGTDTANTTTTGYQTGSTSGSGTVESAKHEAADVAGTAKDAGPRHRGAPGPSSDPALSPDGR